MAETKKPNGKPDESPDKIEFAQATFAGPAAAAALLAIGEDRPKRALDLAKKLFAKGASERQVYAETNKILAGSPYAGVSRTADGQLRFEITDEAARMRPALGRDGKGFLGNVLEHERLYEAYPEARFLGVEKRGDKGGGYTGDSIRIGDSHFAKSAFAGKAMPKDSARGVALHEVQHYAQEAEGHPAGGSPRDFEGKFPGEENRATRMRLYDSLAGEVDAENTRARINMTAERRRAAHPNDTASHPRSEQIVTYADGSTMEQFGGPFPKGYSVKRDTNGLGQTNYKIMHGRRQVGQAYVRDLPDAAQVGRITINEKHQRKGIATALYAQIESDLGKPVIPDSTLSPKAAEFWRKHRPEALSEHVDIGDGTLMYDPMGMMRRAGAKPQGGASANRSRLQEQADALGDLSRPQPNGREMEMAEDIKDFGEKIGGARKDVAKKTGPKPKIEATEKDTRPGWMKRFVAAETIDRTTKTGSGQWTLLDTRKKGRYGSTPAATRMTFASQAEAERAIPLIAVSQKHSVREQYGRGPDGKTDTSKTTFEIWRRVSDRKAVKATPAVFESRDAAMRFMADNAATLLGTARGYGEEILVKPTNPERSGPAWRTADVQPEQFRNEFGFRGVEFGHWQGDRQQVMNMAYDAMRDLADITGVAPESLTFNERLALAFGARGNGGKQAARAHYEPQRAAVNLTREGGAGTLAHEWMHALDHYLATLDDPKLGVMTTTADGTKVLPSGIAMDHVLFASNRVASPNASGSLNETVRAAYRDLMQSMLLKPEQVTVEASRFEKQVGAAVERLKGEIDAIRRDLATEAPSYVKRNRAPASPETLAKFDEIAAKLLAGEGVETKRILNQGRNGGVAYSARNTNEHADAISAIMKEVRGRAGWDSQAEQGPMDRLARSMNAVASAQKLLDQAKASPTQVVMAPTEFARNARTLDQARTTPYWQTREEMAARAFTAYIEDKIKAAGRGSDYLSFGSDNKFYAIFEDHKPFPEGAERAVINEKFDRLFEAMKQTEVLKPIQAVAGRLGTATTIEGAMQEAAGSRPVSEIPGLRGTQNSNNLAAIVENRQAEAAPKAATTQEVRQSGKRFEIFQDGKPVLDSKGKPKWFGSQEKADAFVGKSVTQGTPVRDAKAGKTVAYQGGPVTSVTQEAASRDAKPRSVGDNGGPSEQAIKTAAKLEDVAKRTIERAEKVIAQPRQMNTARRARMGGNVIDSANQDIADAKTALKIAEALKNGEAGALSTVKSLADIRELRRLAKEAEWATDRKEGRNWKEGGHGIKAEDAKNIGKAVGYVRIEPNEVDRLRAVLAGKKGLSADFKALARFAAAAKARNSFEVSNPEVFKAITNVANTIRKADPASLKVKYQHEIKHLKWQAGKYLEEARDFNRKTKLAGTAPEGRQEALRAFLDVRAGKSKPSAAALAERDLIGRKLPGFFPTPESLAKRMADLADIRAGQTVLEPSAGTGRLADAAKALGAKVDTVEMQSSLRDILLKKGHNVVEHDFTSMAAEPKYDRIMMNPPFEKGQDMAHVKRAYEMLKPGGKMVAIMGEGGFFRSDKTATEFRSWLDAVGGSSEKLPEGTFKESNTGVNTRLVVIEKPASPDLKQAELSRQTGEVLMRAADSSREIAAKHGNDLYFQMKAHEQAEHGKLYLERAADIEAGKAKYMPGPDALKEVEARVAAHAEGVYEHGKPVGWSDEARQASADVRAADKAPATLSAVERAMKASEDRAKQAQPSALVEPPKPKRVMEMVDDPKKSERERIANGTKRIGDTYKAPPAPEPAKADAFTGKMKPNIAARAKAALETQVRHNGKEFLTRAALVERLVNEGATVQTMKIGGKDQRVLKGKDGSFMDAREITKTGLDYADHLAASNKTDPVRSAVDAQNAADAKAKAGDFKRHVTLGDGRKVSLGQYTAAWKLAKALPPHTRVNGSPSAYFNGPNTAGDALNEFREGLMDRINQKDPGFGKGRKWDSMWQRDARKLAETLRMKSEVPKGQAHPVDLRPKLAELGRLEEGTFVPKPGGDRSKANQAARNPNYIPGKGVPQEKYWTVKAGPTPTVADLPDGAFKGSQNEFESLSPGMRREIARTAEKLAAKPRTPQVEAIPGTAPLGVKSAPKIERDGNSYFIRDVNGAKIAEAKLSATGGHVADVLVMPEHRRKGLATALYDRIEADLGKPLQPSTTLRDDGFRLWQARNPSAVVSDLRARQADVAAFVASKHGAGATFAIRSGGQTLSVFDADGRDIGRHRADDIPPLGAKPKPVGMDGLTRDQRAGRTAAPVVAEVPTTGSAMDRFRAAYEATLAEQVKANPGKYGYGADRVPAMAQKMTAALAAGNGDIQSPTVKAVAKAMGIKPTVGAIKAALNDQPPPAPKPQVDGLSTRELNAAKRAINSGGSVNAALVAKATNAQLQVLDDSSRAARMAQTGGKGDWVKINQIEAWRTAIRDAARQQTSNVVDAPPVIAEAVKRSGTPIPQESQSTADWLADREQRINASKAAGKTHLDALPRAVEGMRGVAFVNVHDPKERGTVRTVANTGEVVVDWADDYSAEKNLAEPVKDGKKTVRRSWLAPTDLKDYVAEPKAAAKPVAAKPVAAEISPTSTVKMMGIPADGGKPFVMAILDMAGDKKTAAERTWNDTRRLYSQKLAGYELVDKAGNKLVGFQNEANLNSALEAQGKAGKGEAKPANVGEIYAPGTRVKVAKWTGADGDWSETATVIKNTKGSVPKGYHAIRFDDGGGMLVPNESLMPSNEPPVEKAARKTPDRVSSESRAKPPNLGKNSGLRFVGTDATLERGPVNVYITGSGEAVVGDTNAPLDTDGRPLGLRRAPSGIELAAARANKDHRFHASAAKAQPDSLSPNFKPAKPTLPDLKAEAKSAGIKGYSSMTKAALMKALDKSGAVAMIVAPAVAAAVAFDATRAEARAAGDTAATAKGVAAGAVAGGTTAAVIYGIGKAIGAGLTAVARVAPAAAGPAGIVVAGGLTAYGAYKAYQEHKATGKGAAAAALSLIGADHALHLGSSRPPAGPVRLSPEQQSQFAAAAQRWDAMKNAARATDPAEKAKGWSNAARIAAAKARGAEKLPYGGSAAAGPTKWSGSSTSDITAAMKKTG